MAIQEPGIGVEVSRIDHKTGVGLGQLDGGEELGLLLRLEAMFDRSLPLIALLKITGVTEVSSCREFDEFDDAVQSIATPATTVVFQPGIPLWDVPKSVFVLLRKSSCVANIGAEFVLFC